LPVLRFVFSRANYPFLRRALPMPSGMGLTFDRRDAACGWRRLGGAANQSMPLPCDCAYGAVQRHRSCAAPAQGSLGQQTAEAME
jgi:hypothetical protein